MFSTTTLAALLTVATAALAQEGGAASSVAQLVAQLRAAPTEVDRFRLLSEEDLLFDFNNPATTNGVTTGSAGHTVAASSANFPALIGQGVAMTIGYLGPCGMNSPHTHPRATEINFSVNTTLRGGVLVENGARFAEIDIRPGTATIFPQGAIHFEMNPSCEEAMFVAGFNGEDPGVQQVAQRFFGLPPDILAATLGGLGIQEIANLEAYIPDNVIIGVEECLQRCGIERTAQPTSQRQPRVGSNAFPEAIEAVNVYDLIIEDEEAGAAPEAGAEGEGEQEEGEAEAGTEEEEQDEEEPEEGDEEAGAEEEGSEAPEEEEGSEELDGEEAGAEGEEVETGEGETEPVAEGEDEDEESEGAEPVEAEESEEETPEAEEPAGDESAEEDGEVAEPAESEPAESEPAEEAEGEAEAETGYGTKTIVISVLSAEPTPAAEA